jgi:hypothetical protein
MVGETPRKRKFIAEDRLSGVGALPSLSETVPCDNPVSALSGPTEHLVIARANSVDSLIFCLSSAHRDESHVSPSWYDIHKGCLAIWLSAHVSLSQNGFIVMETLIPGFSFHSGVLMATKRDVEDVDWKTGRPERG